jgi:hypothetical protein
MDVSESTVKRCQHEFHSASDFNHLSLFNAVTLLTFTGLTIRVNRSNLLTPLYCKIWV